MSLATAVRDLEDEIGRLPSDTRGTVRRTLVRLLRFATQQLRDQRERTLR